jgi:hypothetical protein
MLLKPNNQCQVKDMLAVDMTIHQVASVKPYRDDMFVMIISIAVYKFLDEN